MTGDRCCQRHPHGDVGQGFEELDCALDHHVHGTSEVARNPAHDAAENEADRHSDETDREGDPRAGENSREHVSTQHFSAEQKQLAGLFHSHEVQVGLEEAPEPVLVAAHEEPDRIYLRLVHLVDPRQRDRIPRNLEGVDEGRPQFTLVEKTDCHRRGQKVFGVTLRARIRCQKAGEDRAQINQQQEHTAEYRHPVLDERAPHEHPARGQVVGFFSRGLPVRPRTLLEVSRLLLVAISVPRLVAHLAVRASNLMRGSTITSRTSEISVPIMARVLSSMIMLPARYMS